MVVCLANIFGMDRFRSAVTMARSGVRTAGMNREHSIFHPSYPHVFVHLFLDHGHFARTMLYQGALCVYTYMCLYVISQTVLYMTI